MNTHESYVSLETAKLLKEAGFDWELNSRWQDWGGKNSHEFILKTDLFYTDRPAEYDGFHALPAPTLDIAQRWLREVKECAVIVETHNVQAACVSAYVYCIYPIDATHPCKHINGFAEDHCFNTYEEAQEAGIKRAIEIILEKGD